MTLIIHLSPAAFLTSCRTVGGFGLSHAIAQVYTHACQWFYTSPLINEVVGTRQDVLQCANKGREEEDCLQAHMDVQMVH